MAKPLPQPSELILFNDTALPKSKAKSGDAFALEAKLRPIYEAILSKGTETPFSVMFSGGWGTGKTSAMRWMDEHLRAVGDGKEGQLKIDTCWFYPWKYQDREDVWKGLIAEVIMASIDFEKVDTNKVLMAAKQFGRFLGGSFVRVLSGLKLSAEVSGLGKAEFAAKDALTGIIEEYGKHVTPQEAYYNIFEKTVEEWIEGSYRDGESRLVIFIDDLDRCLPGIALQVLEAIKLYLNIPNLVVVVGVDRQVIDAVVRKHYQDCLGEDVAGEMAAKARQYLDKMFQVEVPISPREAQVKSYIERNLPRAPIWKKISEDHQRIFRSIVEEIADINPRSVVRALNTAIVGAESETDELKVAQAMQRALITTVLQRLPENEYGPVFDLCLREEGLEFFRKWSDIVVSDPNRPQYLLRSELPESAQINKHEVTSAVETREKRARGMLEKDVEELRVLASEEVNYRNLLTIRALGLLMRIPFATSPAVGVEAEDRSAWEEFRAIVAEVQRVGVDQVTREYIEGIVELDLDDTQVTDAGLKSLEGLTGLTRLDLDRTQVTDAGLKSLEGLTGLTSLYLNGTQVTDAGLKSLEGLKGLTSLGLNGTQVGDVGLKSLEGLKGLTRLNLDGTQVGDVGLKSLEGLKGLTRLDLDGTQVGDAGLKSLEGLKGLTSLYLNGTQVGDAGLKSLEGLTELDWLSLEDTQVGDAGLKSLEGLKGLTRLDLDGTQVGDAGLKSLEGLKGLTSLYLNGTQVGDAGLKSLEGLTGLTSLGLNGTQVTAAGVAALQAKLPQCNIYGL